MLKTLIYHERYDFYFNYGVFSKTDYDCITSAIKLFDEALFSSVYPPKETFDRLSRIISTVEKKRAIKKTDAINENEVDFFFDNEFTYVDGF